MDLPFCWMLSLLLTLSVLEILWSFFFQDQIFSVFGPTLLNFVTDFLCSWNMVDIFLPRSVFSFSFFIIPMCWILNLTFSGCDLAMRIRMRCKLITQVVYVDIFVWLYGVWRFLGYFQMVTLPTISLDFEISEVAPHIYRNCFQGHLFPFLYILLSNVKALPGSHLMIHAYHDLLSK